MTLIDEGKPATQGLDRTAQISSCFQYLAGVVKSIENQVLRNICLEVLADQEFINCYGSNSKHHNFHGGLVVHTSEVMENALKLCESQSLEADTDIVKTAIVLHDYGKIRDYRVVGGKVEYTDHKSTIHHLPKSYALFMVKASQHGLDEVLADKIGHCILAHHGRQEWSSPVTPQTTEAFIVHCADWLSGKVCKDYYVRG